MKNSASQQDSPCPFQSVKANPASESVNQNVQLPKRELAFYLIAVVSIITYAGYGFYLTHGKDPSQTRLPYFLNTGWMKEYSDGGEEPLLRYFHTNWKMVIVTAISYLIVSKATLHWTPVTCHHIVCSLFTLIVTALVIYPTIPVLMAAVFVIVLCLSYFSFAAVWLFVGSILYANCFLFENLVILIERGWSDNSIFVYTAQYGYLLCRLISLGHSLRRRQQQLELSSEAAPTFFEHIRNNLSFSLYYTFYMPYHWSGPILTYDMFREQVEMRGHKVSIDKSTATSVVWRCCRLVLWFFVLQVIYHYLPVGSYLYSLQKTDRIVYKHMSFSMFMRAQTFMLAYVQIYGWPAVIAKLDGIQLLDWPGCISWIYSYTIMWRVFDRGLFAFLQAHIYVPLGGNRHGRLWQLLATVSCFVFICIFHNDSVATRAWVTLNVLQLIFEMIAASIYKAYLKDTVMQYLGPYNEKRLVGYAISWNMVLSWGIISFLLAEGNGGFIVLPEFFLLRANSSHTPLWHMLTFQVGVYCCVQIGLFYNSNVAASKSSRKPHSS